MTLKTRSKMEGMERYVLPTPNQCLRDTHSLQVESASKKNPETVLELAYIQDPKLFDRNAQTRRSKERTSLKTQTGTYFLYMRSDYSRRYINWFLS